MPVRVKICGITNLEDALVCADAGADALGFVFYPSSPRAVTPERAREIIGSIRPFITTVGVFVNEAPETVNAIADFCGLDVAQLHGDETPDDCTRIRRRVVKAFRVKEHADFPFAAYRVSGFLLDAFVVGTPGGTGSRFNWNLARSATSHGPVILAGGLTPENVADAIAEVRPYGVDVSSGVEATRGKKDAKKVAAFVRIAKSCGHV